MENTLTAGLTSIVVVAADSGDDLGVCVEHSLASSAAVELIVSDNASLDGSVDAVTTHWAGDARVRIVHHGKNLGFGAGCNRGAAIARGDALLFLNPDCRIEVDTLARLRAHMTADPRIGRVGPSIVGTHDAPGPASRPRQPTLRRAAVGSTCRDRFGVRLRARRAP